MAITQSQVSDYFQMDLFKELGMEDISSEEREMFLEKIGEVIQQRLLIRFMDELTEDQKTRMEAMLANPDNDFTDIAQFLASEVANFQQITKEEVANYKKELIDRYKV